MQNYKNMLHENIDQGYTKWRLLWKKVLWDMYEEYCDDLNTTFEDYCKQTYESLKQTATLNDDFNLGIHIDLI